MASEWDVLLPALVTALGGLAVMLAGAWHPDRRRAQTISAFISVAATLAAGVLLLGDLTAVLHAGGRLGTAFGGSIRGDAWGVLIGIVGWVSLVMTLVASDTMCRRDGVPPAEYYGLLLLGASGMLLLSVAQSLMVVLLGIEILSLASYVLTALPHGDGAAIEGGTKYFILGSVGSSILLFGMALAYGAGGTLDLSGIGAAPGRGGLSHLGLGLIVIGLAFKTGIAPFHMWVPDAYTGARAVVTGFLATAVKISAFGVFARVLVTAYPGLSMIWSAALSGLAVLTIALGCLGAVGQTRLKRMLAYSSIAHSGFMLLGLIAAGGHPVEGLAATAFYLVVYTIQTVGVFVLLAVAGRLGEDLETLDDCAGLSRRRPLAAAAMALMLVSLTGIPPTAGFMAKLQVLRAAFLDGHPWLMVIGLLGALISVYYYLRPIVVMYMLDPQEPSSHDRTRDGSAAPSASAGWGVGVVIGLASFAIVAVGLFPGDLLDWVSWAAGSLAGR